MAGCVDRLHNILRYYDERSISYHLLVDISDEIIAQWDIEEATGALNNQKKMENKDGK
jgi:hypothetical protein